MGTCNFIMFIILAFIKKVGRTKCQVSYKHYIFYHKQFSETDSPLKFASD